MKIVIECLVNEKWEKILKLRYKTLKDFGEWKFKVPLGALCEEVNFRIRVE